MNKKSLSAILVVAILVLASLAVAIIFLQEKSTVTDDRGKSVYFEEAPERIVSLGSSFTEIIIALNEGERLVGVDYSGAKLEGLPEDVLDLGKTSSLSMETLIALEPDCVIIWNFNMYGSLINDMEEKGLKVLAFYPKTVDDIMVTMDRIGTIMGANATALVDKMQARVDAVVQKTADLTDDQRTKIYLELASKGGQTVGNNTISSELIYMAGGKNIFENGTGYWLADKESIVHSNPQVIVVEDSSTRDEQYFRETYKSTDAVKAGQIYFIDAGTLTTSPRVVDALEDLAKWLQPELFPELLP